MARSGLEVQQADVEAAAFDIARTFDGDRGFAHIARLAEDQQIDNQQRHRGHNNDAGEMLLYPGKIDFTGAGTQCADQFLYFIFKHFTFNIKKLWRVPPARADL